MHFPVPLCGTDVKPKAWSLGKAMFTVVAIGGMRGAIGVTLYVLPGNMQIPGHLYEIDVHEFVSDPLGARIFQ